MPYTVVWGYNGGAQPKRLVSALESIEATTSDEAKREGLQILNELPPEQRNVLKPLAIVEITEGTIDDLRGSERLFLPMLDDDGEEEELEFVDVTATSIWTSQAWWHRQ